MKINQLFIPLKRKPISEHWHTDWECVVEQLQAKFIGHAEEAQIRTLSSWQHHASTPSAEKFCQRAEELVQVRFLHSIMNANNDS